MNDWRGKSPVFTTAVAEGVPLVQFASWCAQGREVVYTPGIWLACLILDRFAVDAYGDGHRICQPREPRNPG